MQPEMWEPLLAAVLDCSQLRQLSCSTLCGTLEPRSVSPVPVRSSTPCLPHLCSLTSRGSHLPEDLWGLLLDHAPQLSSVELCSRQLMGRPKDVLLAIGRRCPRLQRLALTLGTATTHSAHTPHPTHALHDGDDVDEMEPSSSPSPLLPSLRSLEVFSLLPRSMTWALDALLITLTRHAPQLWYLTARLMCNRVPRVGSLRLFTPLVHLRGLQMNCPWMRQGRLARCWQTAGQSRFTSMTRWNSSAC